MMGPREGANAVELNREILLKWKPDILVSKELYLLNAQVTYIHPAIFDGLVGLETLALWNNKLASLDANTFSGLVNLQWLDLRYNQLTYLDPATFGGLVNLKYLWLENTSGYFQRVTLS
jgi:hypothetical protein